MQATRKNNQINKIARNLANLEENKRLEVLYNMEKNGI